MILCIAVSGDPPDSASVIPGGKHGTRHSHTVPFAVISVSICEKDRRPGTGSGSEHHEIQKEEHRRAQEQEKGERTDNVSFDHGEHLWKFYFVIVDVRKSNFCRKK